MALAQMVSDLESAGYQVAPPFDIPACSVGFDHFRRRYWVLAHTDRNGKPSRPVNGEVEVMQGRCCVPGSVGEKNGVSSKMDRLRGLGNAVVPQVVAQIGRAILKAESEMGGLRYRVSDLEERERMRAGETDDGS